MDYQYQPSARTTADLARHVCLAHFGRHDWPIGSAPAGCMMAGFAYFGEDVLSPQLP